MTTMFVRHTVGDYAAWKQGYDAFSPKAKAAGATAQACYQSATDPKDITVTSVFDNFEAAKAFASSAELKDAMKNAGVVGAPSIWFATQR